MLKISSWGIYLLIQVALHPRSHVWAAPVEKQVQVEWVFPHNAALRELDPLPGMKLDDRAAAIWAGHLCSVDGEEALPWRMTFVEQAMKSTTLPARAVEFLAVELAKQNEFPTARTLVAQNRVRFPKDGRLAYLHAMLDWNTFDGNSHTTAEPELPLKPFAERLLGILELNELSPEPKTERPAMAYEVVYTGDLFSMEELLSLRIFDDETRYTILARAMLASNSGWMDFFLPDSVETKDQMVIVWLGCLSAKMTESEFDWLKGEFERRGWKLPWQAVTAFRTKEKLTEIWERDKNPLCLMAAVHKRYCSRSNEPLLVPAFHHFEKSRPALAVMAGLILSGAEKLDEEQLRIINQSLELFNTLPEAPAAVSTMLVDYLIRNEAGQRILRSPDSKRLRQHLADQLIRIGKSGRLNPYHDWSVSQLLAHEGRWDDLFEQWECWNRPSPFGSIWESKLAPWLTIDGAAPKWLEKQYVTQQLPIAGVDPEGTAAEAAYLEAAWRIPNPWFRLVALDWISPEARERATELLAAQKTHDYIACVTLAHWAKRPQDQIVWLKKAASHPNLFPAQLKTLHGRMYLAARKQRWERTAEPVLTPDEVQASLRYLETADLDGEEADRLSSASEYDRPAPKFWPHIHRTTPYHGSRPSFLSEEREPTPEDVRAGLREVLKSKSTWGFREKLSERLVLKLKELSTLPHPDHAALARAMFMLEDWPSAMAQWNIAREKSPEDISILHGGLLTALNMNTQSAMQFAESISPPLRRKVLGQILVEQSSLGLRASLLPIIERNFTSWPDLTEGEAQAYFRPHENTKSPARPAALLKLTHFPMTCYEAWMELNSGSLPAKEKLDAATNLEASRRVILLDPEAGLWKNENIDRDETRNPSFYFLTECMKSGNAAAVEEICLKLESQKSVNAVFWRIRQRITFGEPSVAFAALNELSDQPCTWEILVHETVVALEILARRPLTTGNISSITNRLWHELKAAPNAEIGSALGSLIRHADEKAVLFRRFRDEAPGLLLPPYWLLRTDWYPQDREDGNSPLTQTYWQQRWEAYRHLTLSFAADPQYTWLTLKEWRTNMQPTFEQKLEHTGVLPIREFKAFTTEFYIEQPEQAAEFLFEAPFFQDRYPFDLVPEIAGPTSDPFAAREAICQTCAGCVFLAMQQLTPPQREKLAQAYRKRARIRDTDWPQEYNWSFRKALLTGTSPVEPLEEHFYEDRPASPGEPDSWGPHDVRFILEEWPIIFPNFEKDLASNPKAKANWDKLTHSLRKASLRHSEAP